MASITSLVPFLAASRRPRRRDQIMIFLALQMFQIAFRIASAPIHCSANIRVAQRDTMPGNRNILYLIIGALIVAVGVLGYNLYQTKKEPEGLQINVGPNGLKIQNK
jgi:hypothetical protein